MDKSVKVDVASYQNVSIKEYSLDMEKGNLFVITDSNKGVSN